MHYKHMKVILDMVTEIRETTTERMIVGMCDTLTDYIETRLEPKEKEDETD